MRKFSAVEKGKAPEVEPELLTLKKQLDQPRGAIAESTMMRPWNEQAPPSFPVPLYTRAQGPTHGDINWRGEERCCRGRQTAAMAMPHS